MFFSRETACMLCLKCKNGSQFIITHPSLSSSSGEMSVECRSNNRILCSQTLNSFTGSPPKMAGSESQIYHERQRLQFCLLHSLNNLFQEKDAFTRESLNSIAEKLVADDPNKETWTPLFFLLKPHHNTLTGNYDVNVMIAALEGKGKSVAWHDKRNGAFSIGLDADTLMGIVLNVPVKRYGGLWRGRHWVVMRKIDGVWYNLDSDLAVPHPFQDDDEVRGFLDQNLASGAEILLVNIA